MSSSARAIDRATPSRYHGQRMTEAEFLALPEEKPYLEYVDGVVIQKPMPDDEHGFLVAALIVRLWHYTETHGGRVGPEIRAAFPANFRLPDASYFGPGRASANGAPPTLAVEVRSPGQTRAELRAKCRFFRNHGVDACLLVDRLTREVEVFEAGDEKTLGMDGLITAGALPGFELPVAELFATLEHGMG